MELIHRHSQLVMQHWRDPPAAGAGPFDNDLIRHLLPSIMLLEAAPSRLLVRLSGTQIRRRYGKTTEAWDFKEEVSESDQACLMTCARDAIRLNCAFGVFTLAPLQDGGWSEYETVFLPRPAPGRDISQFFSIQVALGGDSLVPDAHDGPQHILNATLLERGAPGQARPRELREVRRPVAARNSHLRLVASRD